ncbi:MAG: Brp/Blh family beta-carotene 15,15'-dioxygenase, partial [Halobacteriales archaeon]
ETHLTDRGARALVLTVRGGLPMVVPLVAFPAVYRRVLDALAAVVSPAATVPDWPFAPETRLAVGLGFAVVTVVALVAGRAGTETAEQRRAWRVDAGETALLWAFFLVMPPILAVGSYFAVWHSLRHVRRVVALSDAGETAGGVGGPAGGVAALDGPRLWKFARSAAPNTAGGLALFVAIYLATPGDGLLGVAAGYLVAIAVLTLPHAAVVTWLDLRQGVWVPGATPG